MKILIVDDHKLISIFLQHYIEEHFPTFEIYQINEFKEDLAAKIVHKNPNIIILDISLQEVDTMDIFVELKQKLPKTHFIIYTMHNVLSYKKFFFDNGANAYILKENAQLELKEIIDNVLLGKRIFPEEEKIVDLDYRLNQLTFTTKEKQLLAALLENTDSELISKKLDCSKIDILNMRRKLLDKCGAINTQQLITYTRNFNWIR